MLCITPAYGQRGMYRMAKDTLPVPYQPQCLIAESHYWYDRNGLQFFDTVRLGYRSARPSHFDYNRLSYFPVLGHGNGPHINYPPSFFTGYWPDKFYIDPLPNNIDSAFRQRVLFDTFYHYSIDSSMGRYYASTVTRAAYNAASALTSTDINRYDKPGNLNTTGRQLVYYNAAGQLAKAYLQAYNQFFSRWDTTALRTLKYNGTLQPISDSIITLNGNYSTSQVDYYTYAGPGQCATHVVVSHSVSADTARRYTNTYYANGQLKTRFFEQYNGPGTRLQPVSFDSFGYTPGTYGYTTLLNRTAPLSISTSLLLTVHTLNGRKDSLILLEKPNQNSSYSLSGTISIKYNAFNNPVQMLIRSGGDEHVTNYYYASQLTAGVSEESSVVTPVTISPNPASDMLTIRHSSVAPQFVLVRITDMSGRAVQETKISIARAGTKLLLSGNIIPGQYVVHIIDERGVSLVSQLITRL